jgi:hypothetical protein
MSSAISMSVISTGCPTKVDAYGKSKKCHLDEANALVISFVYWTLNWTPRWSVSDCGGLAAAPLQSLKNGVFQQ